ncbi:MAG TPA: DUF1232 domain-containing protein [Methylomusa anaerophila]|uniref:DUF1232 domain-containing protein n=1 Tax=Methylomusa anaerophila TaxID=1930071 RepID=A0A348AG48_9FIRM|nr:DUF1232 domain-containing protein [Methylomusa anaerophila]BBB90046.1 hypothetical protein MAMMFC1_00694 [Methylomusa anaerophila]HML88227.1 DUF1232 domain-containing protein [Methylomusa anaerophila]
MITKWLQFKNFTQRLWVLKNNLYVLLLVLKHPRTPGSVKLMAGAAMFYLISPIDIVSDVVPFFGFLDDLVVVPFILAAAINQVPAGILDECRKTAEKYPLRKRLLKWLTIVFIAVVILVTGIYYLVK